MSNYLKETYPTKRVAFRANAETVVTFSVAIETLGQIMDCYSLEQAKAYAKEMLNVVFDRLGEDVH